VRQRHHGGIFPHIDEAANRRVLGARPRDGKRTGCGRHRDRADLSFAAGALRSVLTSFEQLATRILVLAELPVAASAKPGAGATPWSMAVRMASTSRTLQKRSHTPDDIVAGTLKATTASP